MILRREREQKPRDFYNIWRMNHEESKDVNDKDIKEYNEEGRMRRMSDILPVSLQDILYSRKSDLRAEEIVSWN